MLSRRFAVLTLVLAWSVGAIGAVGAAQSAAEVRAEVARALAGERDFRNITVSLDEEGRVLLSGELRLLWDKERAIRRAVETADGHAIVSELTVAAGESDEVLGEAVARAVRNYEYYTVFDYINGSIEDGVVTLVGKVTPFPDKFNDLAELISKVRGVQELRNQIEVLPPSRGDEEMRVRLGRTIFSHPSFQRFASMTNPPFHVVVHNSVVTLIGYVQTQAEMIEIQQIVSQIPGILRIENQLETVN